MSGVGSGRFLCSLPGISLIQVFLEHRQLLSVTALLLYSSYWLLSCSGPSLAGNSAPDAASVSQSLWPGSQQVSLTSLHWCGKPLMIFRDERAVALATAVVEGAASTSTPPLTVQSWSQVKPSLGFHVFLPASLPAGSCLVSVYGTIHDPILGGSFTIAYLLPDHTSLSLSETPLHSSHAGFQCGLSQSDSSSASAFAVPGVERSHQAMRLCSGMRNTTHIVFSAPWPGAGPQAFFQALQADGPWLPAAH